jgi:hypothetical protein
LTRGGFDYDAGAPRRVTLRRSRTVRLASLAFSLIGAACVHEAAASHLGAIDAFCLAGALVAALAVSYLRYERRQPALIELTAEGVAAFDGAGRSLFQGRIVGFAQWAERLLVLAVAGADVRRSHTIVICADALEPAAFRALAVRGRHAAY